MNQAELEQIRSEIEKAFIGRRFGKVFPLSRTAMAIDFFPHNSVYLFIDIDPKLRTTFLIRRRLKNLERSAVHASPFVIGLRKLLTGGELSSVNKESGKMVLKLKFISAVEEVGPSTLVIHLGAKEANLFVVDADKNVLASARKSANVGHTVGEKYIEPDVDSGTAGQVPELNGRTLSDILDESSRQESAESHFAKIANQARKVVKGEIAKRLKLIKNLEGDLAGHGDAEKWKHFGDLILANISNFQREGEFLVVTDYFDPELAKISIHVDESQTPAEAAEEYFRRYTKARNGAAAIAKRLNATRGEIRELENRQDRLEAAIDETDEAAVMEFLPIKKTSPDSARRKEKKPVFKGARTFVSSDGFEILVGKKAKDNDYLTFRVANSLDLWLHAADYPGSHVVVRNPNRKDVPAQTLIEAAQLAAFYSDARENPKAAVNYTPKKFVNKPRRAAPGLVSLSSFKTILVNPMIADGMSKA